MSEEYQRLQDAARDVEREIAELHNNHRVNSAAELAAIERRLDVLAVKRSSLAKAVLLLRSVSDPQFQQKQKEFVRQLPHTAMVESSLADSPIPTESVTYQHNRRH